MPYRKTIGVVNVVCTAVSTFHQVRHLSVNANIFAELANFSPCTVNSRMSRITPLVFTLSGGEGGVRCLLALEWPVNKVKIYIPVTKCNQVRVDFNGTQRRDNQIHSTLTTSLEVSVRSLRMLKRKCDAPIRKRSCLLMDTGCMA